MVCKKRNLWFYYLICVAPYTIRIWMISRKPSISKEIGTILLFSLQLIQLCLWLPTNSTLAISLCFRRKGRDYWDWTTSPGYRYVSDTHISECLVESKQMEAAIFMHETELPKVSIVYIVIQFITRDPHAIETKDEDSEENGCHYEYVHNKEISTLCNYDLLSSLWVIWRHRAYY